MDITLNRAGDRAIKRICETQRERLWDMDVKLRQALKGEDVKQQSEENTMYTLIATNEQGATVRVQGDSKKAALASFDRDYNRAGWKLELRDSDGRATLIKPSYK